MSRNVRVVRPLMVGLGTLVGWILLHSSDTGPDVNVDDHDAADDRGSAMHGTMDNAPDAVPLRSTNMVLPEPAARSKTSPSRDVSAPRGIDRPMPIEPIKVDGGSDLAWVQQLDQAFKPRMEECIDLAKARKPGLQGLLSFTMITTPTEDDLVVVESMKPLDSNQIEDPELFECLRESARSLEEISAPHDFDFLVPIAANDSQH